MHSQGVSGSNICQAPQLTWSFGSRRGRPASKISLSRCVDPIKPEQDLIWPVLSVA